MNDLNGVDDHTLMAYLDGELAADESHALEKAIADDGDVEVRLRDLAFSDAMLRASVRALAARSPRAPEQPLPGTAAIIRPARWFTGAPRALAAGFVLAIAAGGAGFALHPALVPPGTMPAATAPWNGPAARDAALQSGLEHELSGQARTWADPGSGLAGGLIPVRTWRTDGGRFCREFDAWQGRGERTAREHGVACRDRDGRWRVRVRYYPE